MPEMLFYNHAGSITAFSHAHRTQSRETVFPEEWHDEILASLTCVPVRISPIFRSPLGNVVHLPELYHIYIEAQQAVVYMGYGGAQF